MEGGPSDSLRERTVCDPILNDKHSNTKLQLTGCSRSMCFAGSTIAGMVLVNNPGSWSHIYWPLAHAEWHGWTPTDLIFPFFLFIVGVAIPSRLRTNASKLAVTQNRDPLSEDHQANLIIFALGLFLNGFPYFQLAVIRIPGVLQRIAMCYLVASFIFLKTRSRTQIIITSTAC